LAVAVESLLLQVLQDQIVPLLEQPHLVEDMAAAAIDMELIYQTVEMVVAAAGQAHFLLGDL
jgi:hypothetical protein